VLSVSGWGAGGGGAGGGEVWRGRKRVAVDGGRGVGGRVKPRPTRARVDGRGVVVVCGAQTC
jgi:hypothetical protein